MGHQTKAVWYSFPTPVLKACKICMQSAFTLAHTFPYSLSHTSGDILNAIPYTFCQFHNLRQKDSDVAVCFQHLRLSHIYIRIPEHLDLLQCCSLLILSQLYTHAVSRPTHVCLLAPFSSLDDGILATLAWAVGNGWIAIAKHLVPYGSL